jgi:excisionase family DNA binding protein
MGLDSLAAWSASRSVSAVDRSLVALPAMKTPTFDTTSARTGRQSRPPLDFESASSLNGGPLTTMQAAAILGIHERTVRRYLSSGLLASRRLPGDHYRIPVDALADFWQASEPRSGPGGAAERGALPETMPGSARQRRPRLVSALNRDDDDAPMARNYDLSGRTLRVLRERLSR